MKLTPISLGGPANPDGYFYTDALAIYQGKDAAGNWTGQPADPSNSLGWVLRDAAGELLYVNFNLPYQFAANPNEPYWQARMLEWLFNQTRAGYKGLLLDDVNFAATGPNNAIVPPLVNDAGSLSVPIIGGAPVSGTQWAADLAAFCQLIHQCLRDVFPEFLIIHNTFWRDPLLQAGMHTADAFMKENGFMDAGLTGGTGFWSLASLFAWCDAIHGAGKAVHIEETDGSDPMYSLACSLLMTDGADYWESRGFTPDAAALAVLNADLGNPLTNRYRTPEGLWFRAFEGATVYVNEPGASAKTIAGVTLQPKSGLVAVTA